MLKYALSILTFLMLGASPSVAQLLKQDTARWSYRLSGGVYLSAGNVDRLLLRGGAGVKHVQPDWGFSSGNTYLYGTFGGFQTENDWFSKNFLYLYPKSRLYPYLMGWLETNFRRRIGFRYQIGPGGSYNLVAGDHHLVKLSLTGTYEHTNFDGNEFVNLPPQETDIVQTFRLTGRLYGSHRIGKKVGLNYEFWFQQSLEDSDNYRYHIDAEVSAPLSQSFSIQTQLNYSYENVVVESVEKGDLLWTVGLNFKNITP